MMSSIKWRIVETMERTEWLRCSTSPGPPTSKSTSVLPCSSSLTARSSFFTGAVIHSERRRFTNTSKKTEKSTTKRKNSTSCP